MITINRPIMNYFSNRDRMECSEILIGIEFDLKALYGQQAQILHAVRSLQKESGGKKAKLLPVFPLSDMRTFKSLERSLAASPELQDDLVRSPFYVKTTQIDAISNFYFVFRKQLSPALVEQMTTTTLKTSSRISFSNR